MKVFAFFMKVETCCMFVEGCHQGVWSVPGRKSFVIGCSVCPVFVYESATGVTEQVLAYADDLSAGGNDRMQFVTS